MKEDMIWELRSEQVVNALKKGQRLDQRDNTTYRPIQVFKNISKNAEGSARVRIGESEAICGIKLSPEKPYPDSPDLGTISVGVELMPIASPTFEVGPPSEAATELARVVDRGIRESKCIDFHKLLIREAELAWTVFIDIYVSNDDGNLFDACALAAMVALTDVKVPKLEKDKIVKGEHTGKLAVDCWPMLCTMAKIGSTLVVDPSLAEEKAMSARVSIASTEKGHVCAMQKGGSGSFTHEELSHAMQLAFEKGNELRKHIK